MWTPFFVRISAYCSCERSMSSKFSFPACRSRKKFGSCVKKDSVSHRSGLHRSEEHTSELQSLMRISYAVFCLKQKNKKSLQYYQYKDLKAICNNRIRR